MGIPAVISSNGYGLPIRPVLANAPVMTLSSNGFGTPIVISDNGAPFILQGYDPEDFWDWQTFSLTNGDGGQWVGYSDGGATRPQPAFGSISAQPTSRTTLLALYDDTASGVVLAVFAGNYVSQLDGLQISIGGYVLNSFEVELISGNTWVRFEDMPGVWTPGDVYEVLFGFNLIQGPFPVTNSILGAGGLDYALYDSSALDRMWQESTGQTPAVLASPVGLIVGREKQAAKTFAQVMAGQPELCTNGDFSQGTTDWSNAFQSTIAAVGGRLRVTAAGGTNPYAAHVAIPTVIGRLYNVRGTVFRGTSVEGTSVGLLAGPTSTLADQSYGVQSGATGDLIANFQFVATSTTLYIKARHGNTTVGTYFELDDISVKEVPAHYAIQASAGARSVLQSDGLKFDGSDDNLLTDWFAKAGANCLIFQGVPPASIAGNQTIVGSEETGSLNRFSMAYGADGKLVARVAGGSTFNIGPDRRGLATVAAISFDGATVRVFTEGVEVATFAATGVMANAVTAMRLGALNNAGSPAGYYGGSIKRLISGLVPLTLSQYLSIEAELKSAA